MQSNDRGAMALGVGRAIIEVAHDQIALGDQARSYRSDRQTVRVSALLDWVRRRADGGDGGEATKYRWLDGDHLRRGAAHTPRAATCQGVGDRTGSAWRHTLSAADGDRTGKTPARGTRSTGGARG